MMNEMNEIETLPIEPRDTPITPDAPEMVRGEKPWNPLEMPEIGIDFKRFHSADADVYICGWKNEYISHVYEIRMRRVEDGWRVVMTNDGRKLCSMSAPSRQLAYRCALGAMRAYLRRGHRKTIRAVEKSAKQETT